MYSVFSNCCSLHFETLTSKEKMSSDVFSLSLSCYFPIKKTAKRELSSLKALFHYFFIVLEVLASTEYL